jgi:signal transduction histidine kinase
LVILLVSLLLRRTLRPVTVLTAAARHLGEGNLSQRVPEGGHGELGLLSDTFNTMAEGLEKAEKQHRNLMADVAHELRTPIFNIQGRLEAIADGVFEPDADTINSIYQQVKHLNNLVEDVRTLALAESRKLQLDIQPHLITEVLERCVEDFRAQAELKGISLTLLKDTGIPPIPVDRTRISQVVYNLLQNAIYHTPSGGEVTVSVRKIDHEKIGVSIADTGSGIPEESLPFVFDRFYRADQARAIDTGGSGLGLAIAKELVEAHGGIISADNNTDKGSSFMFELPVSDT